jgi:hypothetical protein
MLTKRLFCAWYKCHGDGHVLKMAICGYLMFGEGEQIINLVAVL